MDYCNPKAKALLKKVGNGAVPKAVKGAGTLLKKAGAAAGANGAIKKELPQFKRRKQLGLISA